MKRVILVLVLSLGCGGGGGSGSGGEQHDGTPVVPTWTTSSADVDCVGASSKQHVAVPVGGGYSEDTIECVWDCADFGAGLGSETARVTFQVVDGSWQAASISDDPPPCWCNGSSPSTCR